MSSPLKFVSILLTLCLILLNTHVHARIISEDKKLLIDIILKQTGTTNVIPLMTNQLSGEILSILKKKDVPLDQNLVTLVQSEAKTVMYEEFILSNKFNEIFYALYDEHFSLEQLKELVAFYDTSTGKKLLSVMPDISRRSMEQAQEHSKGIGSKVQQNLIKRFDEYEQVSEKTSKKTNTEEDPN
tara:strand:+ start:3496 stop:4050 length:555 start_codon:yes stop_codon:yes gene_type:complete